MTEGMGGEISQAEGRDYTMEIGTENNQLNLLLQEAERGLESISNPEQKQRMQTKIEALNEVLRCNGDYAGVRRRVDEIKKKGDSGIRVMPAGEIKQPEGEDLKSRYEYDVLNTLMMRVVDEVKLLQKEGANGEMSLAKQKGKALKTARDNTEYGYERLQKVA